MGTMRVVRIITIFIFMSTCRASSEAPDSGQQEHAINKLLNNNVNDKNTNNKLQNHNVGDIPRDTKQKRDERSQLNKIQQPRVMPKVRPINLRLDTVPRKLNTVPLIKPIIRVPLSVLGSRVPTKKEQFTDIISAMVPKSNANSKDSSTKVNQIPKYNTKATDKQFFEDNVEPLPTERHKLKEFKPLNGEIKLKTKNTAVQPQFTENDDKDDDDINNRNDAKPETVAHIGEKLNCNVTKSSTNEVIGHPHKDTKPVDTTDDIEKHVESTEAPAGTEKITVGVGEMENGNKTSVKVELEEHPSSTECINIDSNDTSLIISNHGFEELRERSTTYTADASDIRNEDSNSIPNWSYSYPYYSYENCNYNYPNNYGYNYDYKTPYDYYNNDVYRPTDTTSCQVIDVKPDNTDRIYRSWKNTEVRINKSGKPVKIDFQNCYENRNGIKMPYFCESRPVMGYGCYGNQNMANPYCMYPSYL